MKYFFIVQGEGRGHISQAIALAQILTGTGHKIVCVMTGVSSNRQIPEYFFTNINAPFYQFQSPNFLKSLNNKGIMVFGSIFFNLLKSFTFLKSTRIIKNKISHYKPDLIINFYEPLAGLTYKLYKLKIPHFCIAHHFLTEHQDFPIPAKMKISRRLLFHLNRITSYHATKIFALSFKPLQAFSHKNNYFVAPPLLRNEVKNSDPNTGDFILGYILNYGFYSDIVSWHQKNADIKVIIFWDKPDAPDVLEVNSNLSFHKPDDKKFIKYLSSCKGYITTAGFESVCEAIYFNKPFVAVPVGHHFEQLCNALDAQLTGKGVYAQKYDPYVLINLIASKNKPDITHESFKKWFLSANDFFLEQLSII